MTKAVSNFLADILSLAPLTRQQDRGLETVATSRQLVSVSKL